MPWTPPVVLVWCDSSPFLQVETQTTLSTPPFLIHLFLEIDFPLQYVLFHISEFTEGFVSRFPSHLFPGCGLGDKITQDGTILWSEVYTSKPSVHCSCWLTSLAVAWVPCSDLIAYVSAHWVLRRILFYWGYTAITVMACSWCWCPL